MADKTLRFFLLMIPGTLLLGINDVLARKILRSGVADSLLVGLMFLASGVLGLALLSLFGLPEIKNGFWLVFSGTVILNVFGQVAWYRAFKLERYLYFLHCAS